jgi:hypothetical protein
MPIPDFIAKSQLKAAADADAENAKHAIGAPRKFKTLHEAQKAYDALAGVKATAEKAKEKAKAPCGTCGATKPSASSPCAGCGHDPSKPVAVAKPAGATLSRAEFDKLSTASRAAAMRSKIKLTD